MRIPQIVLFVLLAASCHGARPVAPVSYTDYEVDYPILTSITDDDKNGLYICHGVLASLESFGPAYGLSFSVFEELLNVTAQRFPTSRAAALVAGNSNYSVLAPTDDAWDASNVEMDMLFSNATMMKQRVDAHIVRLPTLQTSMDKLGAHIAAVIKQPVLLHTQKMFDLAFSLNGAEPSVRSNTVDVADLAETLPVWTVTCNGGFVVPIDNALQPQ